MFLEFTNTLPERSPSTILPICPFWGKNLSLLSYFCKIDKTPTPILFVTWGEIQPWQVKTTCITYLSLEIKPVIIKTISNLRMCHLLSFKKRFNDVTNRAIINLKWRKTTNLFKPLIKENIRYIKSNQFYSDYTHNENGIKGSPKIKVNVKENSWNWNKKD